VTATRLYSTLILSIFIYILGQFVTVDIHSSYLKGMAGCSINCKCEDCKNPFGTKGKACGVKCVVSQCSYFVLDG
jgi:hypothetical protein